MSKNTGDGELDGLITTFIMQYDQKVKIGNKRNLEAVERHKTAIKKYASQEANKARLEEVTAIRKQFHGRRFGISVFMNNRIEELQSLTKEKEGSDE